MSRLIENLKSLPREVFVETIYLTAGYLAEGRHRQEFLSRRAPPVSAAATAAVDEIERVEGVDVGHMSESARMKYVEQLDRLLLETIEPSEAVEREAADMLRSMRLAG